MEKKMKGRIRSHAVVEPEKRLKQEMKEFEKLALAFFIECPKFLTLGRHSDLEETTPLHCYKAGRKIRDFGAPRQSLQIHTTKDGIPFAKLLVLDKEEKPHWLVVNIANRQGFLLPGYVFNEYGNVVRLKRGSPGRIIH
jgi:hypothetical protein